MLSHLKKLQITSLTSFSFSSAPNASSLLYFNQSQIYKKTISETDRENFWLKESKSLNWYKSPSRMHSNKTHLYFDEGEINLCYNCLDRHYEKSKHSIAVIQEDHNAFIRLTYEDLYIQVNSLANKMKLDYKIKEKDSVLIYLPHGSDTIISMLACARLGAVHSVMYSNLGVIELSQRIKALKPKLIISAHHVDGLTSFTHNLENALDHIDEKHVPCIVFQGNQEKNHLNKRFSISDHEKYKQERVECVKLPSHHPMYILETSGTAGKPKGLVRDIAGTSVYLNWIMNTHFKINKKNQIFYSTPDLGWVYGHHFGVYGPLLMGATTLLSSQLPTETNVDFFWKMISKNKVEGFLTFPKNIKFVKSFDPHGELIESHDLKSLKSFTLTGERCNLRTFQWLKSHLHDEVVLNDSYMQSESGFPIYKKVYNTANPSDFGGQLGEGFKLSLLDEKNNEITNANHLGKIGLSLPLPPGFVSSLHLEKQEVFKKMYFKDNVYETGDSGFLDEAGELHIGSRTDDIIKVEGYRLSTGFVEENLELHRFVKRAIVIEHEDKNKGQLPIVFVILKKNVEIQTSLLENELIHILRNDISPILGLKRCIVVNEVPKNKNGVVLRNLLRKICDGEQFEIPDNLINKDCLKEIQEKVLAALN